MKIKIVKLTEISPYYNNPRDNFDAVAPVAESIKRYGFIKPIICDKDGVIIAGHTRYVAAFQLGMKEVPVIYSDMSEEKAKLFRIADNKLAEKSEFDEDKLIEELKTLEVPAEMQAFFFENINDMINFSYNDFQPNVPQMNDYGEESSGDDFVSEEANENTYTPSEGARTEEEIAPQNETRETEYEDLYRVKIVDGKRMMKVVCPYCGNIETIEI